MVVCPPSLRNGLVTKGVIDNIDHNSSSTTAQESFHGTSISLIQCPTKDNSGESRQHLACDNSQFKKKSIDPLPDFYAEVRPLILPNQTPAVPTSGDNVLLKFDQDSEADKEFRWMEHVKCKQDKVSKEDYISWSA